jgi:hypothetical protein
MPWGANHMEGQSCFLMDDLLTEDSVDAVGRCCMLIERFLSIFLLLTDESNRESVSFF